MQWQKPREGGTMTTTLQPPIELAGPSGPIVFQTLEELQEFLRQELNFWAFLQGAVGGNRDTNASIALMPNDNLKYLDSMVSESVQRQTNERQHDIQAHLNATFSQRARIPFSSSSDAQYLRIVAGTLPSASFALAAAVIYNRLSEANLSPGVPEQMLGVTSALNYRLGIEPSVPTANTAALERLHEQYQQLLAKAKAERDQDAVDSARAFTSRQADFEQWRSELTDEAKSLLEKSAFASASLNAKQQEDHAHGLGRLQALEATYNAKLALEAPTEYWNKKRDRHKKFALLWGVVCMLFAVAAISVFLVEFNAIGEALKSVGQADTTQIDQRIAHYIFIGVKGLVFAVIIFWIARLLVRMYLSELHLGMDAYERRTMVLTYLALSKDGKVSDAERMLVLQPIFRPTADGIVKDDASSDPTLTALIARLTK